MNTTIKIKKVRVRVNIKDGWTYKELKVVEVLLNELNMLFIRTEDGITHLLNDCVITEYKLK